MNSIIKKLSLTRYNKKIDEKKSCLEKFWCGGAGKGDLKLITKILQNSSKV